MGTLNKKFEYIYDDLRIKIERQELLPNDKLPSESELIALYGVSRYMARKALEQLEFDGLICKHQGKGCFVRTPPVSMPHVSNSRQILLIASRAEHFYFLKSINGIEQALQDTGYTLTIKLSNYDPDVEALLLQEAFQNDYAGILLFPSDSAHIYTNQFLYRYIEANRIPCILMGNRIPFVNLPSVINDDYAGGKIAAEYLIKQGHTSFVSIMNSEEYSGCMRYAGFKEAVSYSGAHVTFETVLWFGHHEKESIFLPEYPQILELAQKTTSFFCFNDSAAVNLYRLLTNAGYRVPDDISIIGFDDSYLCETNPVALTSIHQDPLHIGYTAAKNLLRIIDDPAFDGNMVFRPYLVTRNSVSHAANLYMRNAGASKNKEFLMS